MIKTKNFILSVVAISAFSITSSPFVEAKEVTNNLDTQLSTQLNKKTSETKVVNFTDQEYIRALKEAGYKKEAQQLERRMSKQTTYGQGVNSFHFNPKTMRWTLKINRFIASTIAVTGTGGATAAIGILINRFPGLGNISKSILSGMVGALIGFLNHGVKSGVVMKGKYNKTTYVGWQ